MSYKNKLFNYQSDCKVLLGRHLWFTDYIKEFTETTSGHGLDIGAGPGGPNGKYFANTASIIDGCDADEDVVSSIPKDIYSNTFQYHLGTSLPLPYQDSALHFVVCSCVVQHLSSFKDLETGIREIARVLRTNGQFYFMFKSGTNDTELTHYNSVYNEVRTFRVFHPDDVQELCRKYKLVSVSSENLLDDNWIPYSCLVLQKE